MFGHDELPLLANMWLSSGDTEWAVYADFRRERGDEASADAIAIGLADSLPSLVGAPTWLDWLWQMRPNRAAAMAAFDAGVWYWGNRALGDAAVVALTSCPALESVEAINLSYNRIERSGLRALAACPYLAGLAELNLSWNDLSGLLDELADPPFLTSLARLDLSYARLTEADAPDLASAKWPALRYLRLEANPFLRPASLSIQQHFTGVTIRW